MGAIRQIMRRVSRTLDPPVEILKRGGGIDQVAAAMRRAYDLPPDIAALVNPIRRHMLTICDSYEGGDYRYASVAEHFTRASSSNEKLALLAALVRVRQAQSMLELGTAYGLSAIAMAAAQHTPKLVTIEGYEPGRTYGPQNIAAAIGGVECLLATKSEALTQLASREQTYDLVFHDGGHTGDAYVEDFSRIVSMLTPGALYLVDDIAWDRDPNGLQRKSTLPISKRTCEQGWLEIVQDPRVAGALAWRGRLGVLAMH